jgi:hypothetical protein
MTKTFVWCALNASSRSVLALCACCVVFSMRRCADSMQQLKIPVCALAGRVCASVCV